MFHFDNLANCVQKYLPECASLLKDAKLFMFPSTSNVLPKDFTPEQCDFINETFFLPFDTVAIEDTASCILLSNTEPNQRGTKGLRFFISCADNHPDHLAARPDYGSSGFHDPETSYIEHGHIVTITSGVAMTVWKGENVGNYTQVYENIVFRNGTRILRERRQSVLGDLVPGAAQDVGVAMQQIAYINNPDRVIAEILLGRSPHFRKESHIPRSNERTRYTPLYPEILKKCLGQSEPTGQHKAPHGRRAHYRRLTSEHFVNKRGQIIYIPSTWIGPPELTDGNHRYRVMTEPFPGEAAGLQSYVPENPKAA